MPKRKENADLVCNIFLSNWLFNKPITDVDFFRVIGVAPKTQRYSLLGKVIYVLESSENTSFAKYTPSESENFVIGFLEDEPKQTEYSVETMKVVYEGKQDLPPNGAGKRALLELIYNTQQSYLKRSGYWKGGYHVMYPWKWENVHKNFNMFRGPHFYYHILSDGKILLVLDTKTHYIHSEPFLNEVYRRGRDLKWFEEEITEKKKYFEAQRRKFRGIYFHYILEKENRPIDGVDPRPISDIMIEVDRGGKRWKGSLADFLRKEYPNNRRVKNLDTDQPGVCQDKYTYAPQMLHRHVDLGKIPRWVKNKETFLKDPEERDIHYPARKRWEYLEKELEEHFHCLKLGSQDLVFTRPLTVPADTHHFDKPRLLVRKNGEPIEPRHLKDALKKGGYQPPDIEEIFLFSIDDTLRDTLWSEVEEYFQNNFGWLPPEKITPVETSEVEIQKYLERKKAIGDLNKAACLAIIADNSGQHDMLNNLFGRFDIPVQCVEHTTATNIVNYNLYSFLEGICAGIFAKSEGIPWLLYDKLNYDRYAAVDVGRRKSEWWAMSVVYSRDGRYETLPGEMLVGEDLNAEAIRKCVSGAIAGEEKPESFVLLRDGDISEKELRAFEDEISKTDIQNCGIISIKKDVPHRIFRRQGDKIFKPFSGDFVVLDENLVMVCCAGIDEYEHGTPRVRVIEGESIEGDIDIVHVAKDIFYLSYLNWGSPGRSYSEPAPLRLAHNLASELSRGLTISGPPF